MSESWPKLSPAEMARYSRHLLLDEIGLEGQRRLAASRVLIVGAGGLGSPAALYLAAAGVGTLGIADLDQVEPHNLQRQLLHDDAAIGEPKVTSAARRLRATNPFIVVIEHPEGVTAGNAVDLFTGYDLVIDGTDNFSSRYLINDAAFFARRPLVSGSVFRFEGQVAVYSPATGGPCHRCLFPDPPAAGSVPGCGEAGVMGAVCGVIGSLQALEAIKLITGAGEPLIGRILTYNGLAQSFHSLALPRDPQCRLCGPAPTIRGVVANSAVACERPISPMATEYPVEISVSEAKRLLDAAPERTLLLDVREPYEAEICQVDGARSMPMGTVPGNLAALPRDQQLLVMCHHGGRSRRVTDYLRAQGFDAVTNIAGGIDAWAREIDPALRRY